VTAIAPRSVGWVFVTDDDASVRKAVARLLRSAGFQATAFATAEEFLQEPLPDAPACAILDVHLPGLDGLALQRALAEKDATLPVVFITGYGDIPTTVRAMRAGAVDFLPKPFDNQALLAAVRQAVARHRQARQELAGLSDLRQRYDCLSTREREVLSLVVTGMLNKQVGHKLGVTEKTVKAHRAQIMQKMHLKSLAELVRIAGRLGVDRSPVQSKPDQKLSGLPPVRVRPPTF
jgi:FixJ family two-component response regulator